VLNEILYQDKLRKCLHSGTGQGGGAQGTSAPDIIGLCVIIFHTDYIFYQI